MVIDDIEHFADQVIQVSDNCNYQQLTNWGELLLKQLSMFDIQAVKSTLSDFPKFIEIFKSI